MPGYEAPVYVAWSQRNRSALIRIPLYKPGSEQATRAEIRCPDPACNPYLTFAALLHAGLEGIEKGYELEAPMETNLYHLTAEQRKERGIEALPQTLGEAVDALSASELMKRALGDHIFPRYVELKRQRVGRLPRAALAVGDGQVLASAVTARHILRCGPAHCGGRGPTDGRLRAPGGSLRSFWAASRPPRRGRRCFVSKGPLEEAANRLALDAEADHAARAVDLVDRVRGNEPPAPVEEAGLDGQRVRDVGRGAVHRALDATDHPAAPIGDEEAGRASQVYSDGIHSTEAIEAL